MYGGGVRKINYDVVAFIGGIRLGKTVWQISQIPISLVLGSQLYEIRIFIHFPYIIFHSYKTLKVQNPAFLDYMTITIYGTVELY